jgi:hypothetical protein
LSRVCKKSWRDGEIGGPEKWWARKILATIGKPKTCPGSVKNPGKIEIG